MGAAVPSNPDPRASRWNTLRSWGLQWPQGSFISPSLSALAPEGTVSNQFHKQGK